MIQNRIVPVSTKRRNDLKGARLFPNSLGSSEPWIPFWPRCHAFPRSGMRACKDHPLLCAGASECMGGHSHACHSGGREFPELCVHSRTPLDLVNLGFHFGRVVIRFHEVACVRASLTPCFAQVPQSAWGFTLTHATPVVVTSRGCASIPKVPWVY